jgi:tRNA A-37 threonylcarbamoyl transferase component Bud32
MGDSGKMYRKSVYPGSREVELQMEAASLGFAPRILAVEKDENEWIIVMEDIEADCLADVYGEDPEDIPEWIWDDIRLIVSTLLTEKSIEYIDITPYNFIEKDGRVYIIDFGDAKYEDADETNWFLLEFINGENSWNPDYK